MVTAETPKPSASSATEPCVFVSMSERMRRRSSIVHRALAVRAGLLSLAMVAWRSKAFVYVTSESIPINSYDPTENESKRKLLVLSNVVT